jgi:hypothetical protein
MTGLAWLGVPDRHPPLISGLLSHRTMAVFGLFVCRGARKLTLLASPASLVADSESIVADTSDVCMLPYTRGQAQLWRFVPTARSKLHIAKRSATGTTAQGTR